MITWPVIIKHDGEDELIYVKSLSDWQADEEMLLYIFTERDVLIDSKGKVFSLPLLQKNIHSEDYLATCNLDNVIELLKAHAAIMGQCCVEKIQTNSIADAIELVASIND